jgi:hypothetical protein
LEGEPLKLEDLFGAMANSGARILLIGRQALVLLGLPVNTADIDVWLHPDDIEAFNRAMEPLGFSANRGPGEARGAGRYVLENDEHIDVLVAKVVRNNAGQEVGFEEIFSRRRSVEVAPGVNVAVPALDDLIATKRFGSRPRDAEDIRLLERLRERERDE